jgi:hypothetical protein
MSSHIGFTNFKRKIFVPEIWPLAPSELVLNGKKIILDILIKILPCFCPAFALPVCEKKFWFPHG